MSQGLLDTSVFIARESRGLDGDALPAQIAVSVVTQAELGAGVLAATDLEVRARRMATLAAVAAMRPVAIDVTIAQTWSRLRVQVSQARRRVDVNDMWIAATALSLHVPVVTQDDDFAVFAELSGLEVILV